MSWKRKSLVRPKLMLDATGQLITGKGYDVITKQASAKRCDLNSIIKKYKRTGSIPERLGKPTFYGDFSGNVDLQAQMDTVRSAREKFNALPPELRSRFRNNPVELVKFCNNADNLIEARKLGLAKLVEPTATVNEYGEAIPVVPTPNGG